MRIFVYDDLRTLSTAVQRLGIDFQYMRAMGEADQHQYTLVRPFRHDGFKIVADHDNAIDMIDRNLVFDVWVLDNDLSDGLEGFQFLKDMLEKFPEKAPSRVVSCSANFDRARQIESYFRDWKRVHDDG